MGLVWDNSCSSQKIYFLTTLPFCQPPKKRQLRTSERIAREAPFPPPSRPSPFAFPTYIWAVPKSFSFRTLNDIVAPPIAPAPLPCYTFDAGAPTNPLPDRREQVNPRGGFGGLALPLKQQSKHAPPPVHAAAHFHRTAGGFLSSWPAPATTTAQAHCHHALFIAAATTAQRHLSSCAGSSSSSSSGGGNSTGAPLTVHHHNMRAVSAAAATTRTHGPPRQLTSPFAWLRVASRGRVVTPGAAVAPFSRKHHRGLRQLRRRVPRSVGSGGGHEGSVRESFRRLVAPAQGVVPHDQVLRSPAGAEDRRQQTQRHHESQPESVVAGQLLPAGGLLHGAPHLYIYKEGEGRGGRGKGGALV